MVSRAKIMALYLPGEIASGKSIEHGSEFLYPQLLFKSLLSVFDRKIVYLHFHPQAFKVNFIHLI